MRLLTMNCWHGLDGAIGWKMGELESGEQRAEREARQTRDFVEAQADVLFLQEVNRLHVRAPQLAKALGMDWVGQTDLAGVKLLRYGLPINLNSGLCILAKRPLRLKSLGGVRLSGPWWSVSGHYGSLQTAECRFALLAEIETRELGRLLIVDVHLHHRLEANPQLARQLDDLVEQGVLTAHEHQVILGGLSRARDRRIHEMQRLLRAVRRFGNDHWDGVIVAGDMNTDADSPCLKVLTDHEFTDLFAQRGLTTWDAERNSVNFKHSEAFHEGLPDFGKKPVRDLLRQALNRKRRLDTILLDKHLAERAHGHRLFGADRAPEQMTSDHFGLQVEL